MRNLGLIFTFWLASLAMPGISFALGLGEIDVSSFLNQPLKAEIEVISARPGEIDDLLVSLASRDSFARAGLSRPNHLSDLRFAVKKNDSGDQATIVVTTKTAIKEPFLNFLVEADWSKGRVLREFTVLLDPPFFANSAAAVTSTSEQASSGQIIEAETDVSDNSLSSGSIIASTSVEVSEPISEAVSSSVVATTTEVSRSKVPASPASGSVVVKKGDALWSIASQFKDSEHSMGQVMLAMKRANPAAFGNDNINNLKVGAVLRTPTADEIDQLSKQEAYAQVLDQNGLWDDYVAKVSGNAVSVASGDGGSNGNSSGGDQNTSSDLSLLTPGDSDSTGQGESAGVGNLKKQLALAEEQLDASRLENQDMQSRIADLEARLSKFDELQKMVEIEDDSLAQLQANQVEEVKALSGPTTQETAEISETPNSLVEELQAADEDALLDEILSESTEKNNNETIESVVPEDSITDETELEIETEVAPPAPVIVTETERQEPSFLDGILPPGIVALIPSMSGLLDNPVALGGIGGIVILLLGFILYKRRKGSDDEEDSGITVSDPDAIETPDLDDDKTPVHFAEIEPEQEDEANTDTNINVDLLEQGSDIDDEEDEFSKTAVISSPEDMAKPESEADPAPAEQDDVLNEIDVYLAYGLYDNAEELLRQSLDATPDRADYRSKLLDTYFATKNVDAFSKEAELLKSMGSAGARYWDKAQVMGYELAPDNALFSAGKDSSISAADLEIAKPEVADFDLGASEDDTNFSSTDFNLGEDDNDNLGADSIDFAATQAVVEKGEVTETQEIPELADFDLGSPEDDSEEDLPDELGVGELEFTLDSDNEESDEVDDISQINFDEPDGLELDIENDDLEDVSLDFDMEEPIGSADGTDFDLGGVEDDFESTDIIDVPSDTDAEKLSESVESSRPENDINLGMDDTSISVAPKDDEENTFEIDLGESDEEADLDLGLDIVVTDEADLDLGSDLDIAETDEALLDEEQSEDKDLSLLDDINLDMGEEDDLLEEKTLETKADSLEVEESLEIEETLSADMDLSTDNEEPRTGTFAPGDFDDPDDILISDEVDIDDIGDLMLPDDVDEVSTKLDLARAFIDMGDAEGARGSLDEVLAEGTEEQKAEATQLLEKI